MRPKVLLGVILVLGFSIPASGQEQKRNPFASALAEVLRETRNVREAQSAEPSGPMQPEATNTCFTYALPDAGVGADGYHYWGVVNQVVPNSRTCVESVYDWENWSVPVAVGETVEFALTGSVQTYFSLDHTSVYYTTAQTVSYTWTVPASYTRSTLDVTVSPNGIIDAYGNYLFVSSQPTYTLAVRKRVAGSTNCSASSTALCLAASRFKVTVDWQSTTASGNGTAVGMTSDTGYFWFFSSGNVEAIVKVLDGTTTNGHFWVFAAGLTNVQATITVTDTKNGVIQAYTNPQGTAFQPVQDTLAFTP